MKVSGWTAQRKLKSICDTTFVATSLERAVFSICCSISAADTGPFLTGCMKLSYLNGFKEKTINENLTGMAKDGDMKPSGLQKLEEQLMEDLQFLEYPPAPWLPAKEGLLDVAIVGGGMAGLAAAFGLMREGISNIQVFDASPVGFEGPWATYARMNILRSHKKLVGPALDIPRLTFQAWYRAKYGDEEWQGLYKIPTPVWMDYLRWYREVLKIPVQNACRVTLIEGCKEGLRLSTEGGPARLARKAILATGRGGFGKWITPPALHQVTKSFYAHTCEEIGFENFKGKEICILGAGSSGFDAAATALEQGAAFVTILEQRAHIPFINKFASTTYCGFTDGFYNLPDEAKIAFIQHGFDTGAPPPFESLDRVRDYPNFKVLTGVELKKVEEREASLVIATNRGQFHCAFVILATGFAVDVHAQQELRALAGDILLWKERLETHETLSESLGNAPYLGRHFEFQERTVGRAPSLKHLYCFNYAATLSHGNTSGDIPAISAGAARLAKGIASDFFTQNWPDYLQRLREYATPEFLAANYPFID